MEILSTGEKIKRTRVYQGVTLKDLCGDKISISKMSCIENGKIKADEDILQYIAKRLNIQYQYLVQDVEDQILDNLKLVEEKSTAVLDFEKFISYNISFAIEYEYYNIAFKFTHILFENYVENNKIENIQPIISQYYDLYQKNNCRENTLIYYKDMATFFMTTKEYNEAINYYQRIRVLLEEEGNVGEYLYTYICYYEGICYGELDLINESYERIRSAVSNVDSLNDVELEGKIYQAYVSLSILLQKVEVEKYLKKVYELFEGNKVAIAKVKSENGMCYFRIGEIEKAKDVMLEGLKIFRESEDEEYVKYLIRCIEILYRYKEYDLAFKLSDEALNLAICSNDDYFIERAYYFKGMIYQKQGLYREAEMYMNLSTDHLLRFATKENRYKRYNEMAELYYNLDELKEAIKYFTLAMNLEKKL